MEHIFSTTISNLLGALCVGVGDLQNDAMSDAASIDPTMLTALLAIYTRPDGSIGVVARTAYVSHSGAVRTIDRLVALGLVLRRLCAGDRRVAALTCTPAGAALAERALNARRSALDGLIAETLHGTADRAAATHLLERLLACLHPATREAAWRICRLCEHAVCRGSDCPVGSAVA